MSDGTKFPNSPGKEYEGMRPASLEVLRPNGCDLFGQGSGLEDPGAFGCKSGVGLTAWLPRFSLLGPHAAYAFRGLMSSKWDSKKHDSNDE